MLVNLKPMRFSQISLVLACLLIGIFLLLANGNGQKANETLGQRQELLRSDESVRERIAVLVAARLKDRETLLSKPAPTSNSSDATSGEFKAKPSGVIVVYTRIPPAKEMVEEIIQYGDVGLKFLTSYLKSNKEGERFIAIEFIGLLGGERIIAPLKEVLQTDASSSIRVFALRWLATAPLDKVLPIISEEAKSNTDEAIRKEAGIVLLRLKGDTSRPDEINFQNVESNSVKPLATPQT